MYPDLEAVAACRAILLASLASLALWAALGWLVIG